MFQHLAQRQIQFPRPPTRSILRAKALEQRSTPFAFRNNHNLRLRIVKSASLDLPRAAHVSRAGVRIVPDFRTPGSFDGQFLLVNHSVVLETIDADVLLAEESVGEGDVPLRTSELEEAKAVRAAHAPGAVHASAFDYERDFGAGDVADHEALVAGCVPAQGAHCVVADVEPAVDSIAGSGRDVCASQS